MKKLYERLRSIPPYSEELIADLHDRQSQAKDELMQRFGLTKQDLEKRADNPKVPRDVTRARKKNTLTQEEADDLYSCLGQCVTRSNIELSPDQRDALMALGTELVNTFDRLFILRSVVLQHSRKQETETQRKKFTKSVIDIHSNLVTREALVNIKNFGFSDADSFAFLKDIIKHASLSHMEEFDKEINPKPPLNKNTERGRQAWLLKTLNLAERKTEYILDLYNSGDIDTEWHR